MPNMSIIVRAEWDHEAKVFVATSDDVPGLVAEASTPQDLMEKLEGLIPELMELNHPQLFGDESAMREVPLFVMSQQMSKVRIPA